jgi:ubiquinone/menaquinone biosynthesis C-methylase UbiE
MTQSNQYFINDVYHKKKYNNPKEIFSFLTKLLNKENKKDLSLIDVGCASGELLYHLKKKFPNYKLTGIDIDDKLLSLAKKFCSKDISFKKMNVANIKKNVGKFDIVILSGVLSIFSNAEIVLKNLIKILKPKGKIFIFESLNTYSFNLKIKSESFKKNKKIIFYKNIYSTDFIKRFALKNDKKCKFFPVELKINLKKNKKNLIYGWTEYLSKKKIVTSGLGIIHNQFWTKIY